MDWSTLGLPIHYQFPELSETKVHRLGDAIQPSHPLPSPSLPAFNLSQQQGLFQWVSLSIRWPKYWSFSFSITPSNEHPGLISFRMDWLDLLAVQGTLKSLLQHHGSKASILHHSAFFSYRSYKGPFSIHNWQTFFFQSVLSFHFHSDIIWNTNVFNLIKSTLPIFFSVALLFVSYLRILCQTQSDEDLHLCFLLRVP